MATITSNQLTNRVPVPGFGAGGGQLRTQYFDVTTPAVVTTSDVINLGYLPPHAVVRGVTVKNAALGAGTLQVGDTGGFDDAGVAITADPDRYVAAYAVTSASSSVTLATTGMFFYTGSRPVLVTASLATGPSSSAGLLQVGISYTVEEPQRP